MPSAALVQFPQVFKADRFLCIGIANGQDFQLCPGFGHPAAGDACLHLSDKAQSVDLVIEFSRRKTQQLGEEIRKPVG